MTTEFSPKTHTVLAVVLGILGILIGFLLTFVGGVVAGALALILGVAALLIGVKDYKATKKGMGSIIVGVLAILVAIVMTVTSTAIFSALQTGVIDETLDQAVAQCCARSPDAAGNVRCAARSHTRHDDWLRTDPQNPKNIWWYSDVKAIGFRVVCEVPDNIE